MTTFWVLLGMALRDAWRSRWLLLLVIGLAVGGELLLRFGGGGPTTLVSLLDVALIVTPLAGLVVGTLQVHHGREMTELLLAQPIARGQLFIAQYLGAVLPLATALVFGLLAPFAWHGLLGGPMLGRLLGLAGMTVVLTMTSLALAFLIALRVDDRVRALTTALLVWLVGSVLWDGLLLLGALLAGPRPVESALLVLLAANPFDLARVLLLLGSEASIMLGYTGAVVQDVVGTRVGQVGVAMLLLGWIVGPVLAARRALQRKDF